MLSATRNKSKGWVAYLIVGLITVPFALFGIQDYVSRSANNSIATVDGEDIDINIYYQMLMLLAFYLDLTLQKVH